MPFASYVGLITRIPQQAGNSDRVVAQYTTVTRLAQMFSGHSFWHVADAVAMIIDPGKQHGAGRRAGRRDMKIGKPYPFTG
ncbi:hypothetical protein D3C84_503720 [compost metagenome]